MNIPGITRIARRTFAVAALASAVSAPAALNAYRTSVKLAQDQKAADGKLLKAGAYDVDINFSGKGSQAEFVFLQGGVVIARQAGEARGFPAGAPNAPAASQEIKQNPMDAKVNSPAEAKLGTVKVDAAHQKIHPEAAAASPAAFSWGAAGFGPGIVAKSLPSQAGRMIIAVDSSNSAAGFRTELLPAVKK